MSPTRYRILTTILGIISVGVFGVCVWAIASPIKLKSQQLVIHAYDEAGHSPRIGIAAGILLLITSIYHFLASLEKKQNLIVGILCLLLCFSLSVAAMGVAVSDITQVNKVIQIFSLLLNKSQESVSVKALEELVVRLKAIAAVTGIVSGFEIVALIMGGLLLKAAW